MTKLFDDAKITIRYTPPYSPDKNPIEYMWSKMKTSLRELRIRDDGLLPDAVRRILSEEITTDDCLHWCRKDGYAPARSTA